MNKPINISSTNLVSSKFVLLICPSRSYRVSQYIKAAANLNYRLIIVSDSKHSLISSIANGIIVNFQELDDACNTVLQSIRELDISAVIATDDICSPLSSKLAAELNLQHNSLKASQLTFRKDLARIALKNNYCNTPFFKVMNKCEINVVKNDIIYPVVIKPLMLSGSKGVMRVNDADEFTEKSLRLFNILQTTPAKAYEKEHILVESYLQGAEVAIDGFINGDNFQLFALFDKPEPLEGPYFEESYYITPSRHSKTIQTEIIQEIIKCCQAYGLNFGPIHAEARITRDGIYLIEMASRTIGGQCAQLLEYSLGVNLEELVLKLLCNETVTIERNNQYPGVLMIPIPKSGLLKRVEGLSDASKVSHIEDIEIHIQPGYELIPLPEGNSYLGFIFALSTSFESTYQALKNAHDKLKFITQDTFPISQN